MPLWTNINLVLKIRIRYLFILLAFVSCNRAMTTDDDTILARVHDEYLYASGLRNIIPENTTPHDSIVLVKNFVNNWVKTKLMTHQAEKNLTGEQLDFDQQLEEYRNSLIIFSYERELINQNLDTIVSDEQIEKYYMAHLGDFELKENIAKVIYTLIDYGIPEEEHFELLFSLPDSVLIDSLEVFSKVYARTYFLDTATWIRFSELQEILPIENYNLEMFTKNRRFFKLVDENNIYMLKFVDFKIKDDTSPLAFKRNDIRNIIVNKRKLMLVKKVREDIYKKALQNDEFEIYYKK
ncbi:MAG: hypothetical protein L3J31_07240 [Bacteroidales bacterium]|nr:hypothetical protein [Bacteroidales bacterium]